MAGILVTLALNAAPATAQTSPPAPTPAKRAPRGKTRRRTTRRPIESPPVVRWIVGHEPHLSRLAAFAVGAPADSIRLPKGAFALVAFDGRGPAEGAGVLTGLVDPDVLKAVRSDRRR